MTQLAMHVHVLIIEHRFGTNVTVHESENGAYADAAEFAETYWSEISDTAGDMPTDERLRVAAYFDAHPEESFSVTAAVVEP